MTLPMRNKLLSIVHEIEKHLRDEENKGIRYLIRYDKPCSAPSLSSDEDKKRNDLFQELEKKVALCSKCSLFTTRKNYVFGEGSLEADLVFVGEAPGADEDEQGLPFVGAAGKLLTKIIQSIGLKREDVYICNILKCRPPGNRTPLPAEMLECKGYVLRQLEIIRPKIICTLGGVATQALLQKKEGITRLRGHFYDFGPSRLIPTFHPAYLLRDASKKREVWEDMKTIKKELGI